MKRQVVLLSFTFLTLAALLFNAFGGQPAGVQTGEGELPVVGSYDKLQELLLDMQQNNNMYFYGGPRRGGVVMEAAQSVSKSLSGSVPAAADYSATNVQVKGVDEADIIKTDGAYIYQVNNQRVVIARAYPADQMSVVTTLQFEANFMPQELYVDEKHLVVIGSTHTQYPALPEPGPGNPKLRIAPPMYYLSSVKAMVFDIRDKANVTKVREVELEGSYISSRKIGSALYIVANKYVDYYYIMEQQGTNATPLYRDSAGSAELKNVAYEDIRYFPRPTEPNYLMIAGINLDGDEEMALSTYLGSGHNIYASQKNLYVAVTQYSLREEPVSTDPADVQRTPETQITTQVYKFAMEKGSVSYSGKGEVPGNILNQFSMDEHKNHFRIATTSGDMWREDEHTSKNNLYILNADMNIVGQIEGIAPGERIYSVRFMGDRGYMVTFKNVDPLFVIDLKNPKEPKILGALKIPGYSDYLHPYDENHIIGFGKDTVEMEIKDWGRGSMAFYQGLKIAVFDVSDVENPKEKFKEIIGDRGTESELLHNHKALLFDREKNLLAFPVTVMEVRGDKVDQGGFPAYGEFAFQGAYVYHLDLKRGFDLRGKLTNISSEEMLGSGYGWYDSGKNVERIIYIGENLYTLSRAMIKAYDLSLLTEKNTLLIQ